MLSSASSSSTSAASPRAQAPAGDRRVGRPPDSGPRHRPRLAIGDADEALRPARPRPRARPRAHHAARPRRARRRADRRPTATACSSASPIPNDIRGTGFLVWEHPNADDERFLYLPSLGRVRRIAGTETQESFVGSDFTYEDIGGREFDDYTYAFAGPDGENASWTPPAGGAARPAWRLESRRKDASAEFPRVVSLVLKDSFVVVGADIYNRRNEKQKVYTVRRLEQIEGIWTVMESEMTNALEKTRTELVVETMDYNVGLKEADFSRRELEADRSSK